MQPNVACQTAQRVSLLAQHEQLLGRLTRCAPLLAVCLVTQHQPASRPRIDTRPVVLLIRLLHLLLLVVVQLCPVTRLLSPILGLAALQHRPAPAAPLRRLHGRRHLCGHASSECWQAHYHLRRLDRVRIGHDGHESGQRHVREANSAIG